MSDHVPDDSKERLEAAYERFAEHVAEAFQSGRSLGRQGFEAAMEKTRERLAAAGEFSAGQGERFKEFLRRDLGTHLDKQAQMARQFSREAGQHLQPERLRDGMLATLATMLRSGGETLQEWSHKANEAVIYESGEITSAGSLTCLNCGHAIHLDKTAHVAPCPACLGTRFRKSY
ncbi:MAG: hypothetical protein HYU74_10825 [Dechloromonas sp.]|nr:hypothetical protein [Dechloromonas sp.]